MLDWNPNGAIELQDSVMTRILGTAVLVGAAASLATTPTFDRQYGVTIDRLVDFKTENSII